MHPLIYASSLLLLVLSWVGVGLGGWWTLAVPLFSFSFIPLVELFLSGTTANTSTGTATTIGQKKVYDLVLYAIIPMQVGLVVFLMHQVASDALTGWSTIGAIVTVGISCAGYGINAAHELGHHPRRFDQQMAKVLLLTSLYMHFFIEHNRGHHARVATEADPASAPIGMSLYAFWWRSVIGGWRSAWALENRRLVRRKRSSLSIHNEMLRFQLLQAGCVAAALVCFGPIATVAWVLSATLGILLLETINYVEHYGLRRQPMPNGKMEQVKPAHSWNSNHPLGRVLLLEVTRHSDHHAFPARKYPALRHFDDSPQLPTGYPGMILLSLLPPAWFAIMNPHTHRELKRLAS